MNSSDGSATTSSAFEDFLSGKPEVAPDSTGPQSVVPPDDHDPARVRIIENIRAALTYQLRSEALTVLPTGTPVRVRGNLGEFEYSPDAVVDSDVPDETTRTARRPLAIFEVAAAGSERAAFIDNWQVQRLLAGLDFYVRVDSSRMAVTLSRRAGEQWQEENFADADDQLFLPAIHCLLSLDSIYEGALADEDL